MTDRNYMAITTVAALEKRVRALIADGLDFGFDIEAGYSGEDTEGLSLLPFHPRWQFAGFSFTNSEDWAAYVPVGHDGGGNIDDPKATAKLLWELLQTGLAVIHNAAYELRGVSRWFRDMLSDDPDVGEAVRASNGLFPFKTDSMLEAFMLALYDPLRVGKDLKNLTLKVFGHEMLKLYPLIKKHYEKLGKKPPTEKKLRFTVLELTPEVIEYACEDALWCLKLSKFHLPQVEASKANFMFQIELKLLPVLIEMEMEGMLLDWETISKKTIEVAEFRDLMAESILEELSERLGRTVAINLASPPQLAKVLYDPAPAGLGLVPKKVSEKTGVPSTDEESLRAVAKQDSMIARILQWKEVAKLYGSYLKKYDTQLNYSGNGRARPSHKQEGAQTGRLSVDGVSYQQWPKPYHYELPSGKTFDMAFRDLLISPPDYRIIGFDFSQVELRVLAAMAHEDAMLEAFRNDIDIHKATAARMFGMALEDVTKKDRAKGKTGNFAVVYQSGAQNMADMMGTTKEEAQEMLDAYYAGFPSLRNWMDKQIAEGSAQKYVETFFGRKFTIWEYFDQRNFIRSKGDRMCINAPVQGGAADYMKIGMVRVSKAIKKAEAEGRIPKGSIRLIMTIHDALEFYVHEDISTQTVIDLINPCVSFPVKGLDVEIRADWHEGRTWGGVVEIKTDKQKQITHYMVEDVDIEFAKITDAYEYMDGLIVEKAEKPEPQAPSQPGPPPNVGDPDNPTSPWQEPNQKPKSLDEMRWEDRSDDIDFWRAVIDAPARQKPTEEDSDLPPWAASEEYRRATEKPRAQQIVITLSEMPNVQQWTAFQAYLDQHPGEDSLVFATDEGEVLFEEGTFNISEADQTKVNLLLGGAAISHRAAEVEQSMVMEGLTL